MCRLWRKISRRAKAGWRIGKERGGGWRREGPTYRPGGAQSCSMCSLCDVEHRRAVQSLCVMGLSTVDEVRLAEFKDARDPSSQSEQAQNQLASVECQAG